MKRFARPLVTFLVVLFPALSVSCHQGDRCAQLKKEAFDFDPNSPSYLKELHAKLQSCGFDSTDLRVAAPFLANLMIQRRQLTYGDIIAILEEVKWQPWYAASRRRIETEDERRAQMPIAPPPAPDYTGLCGVPGNPDSISFDFPLPHYYEYKQALTCCKQSGKKLLLYFTGYSNALGRMLEQRVLCDPEVKALLQREYIMVLLTVDVGSVGERNDAMEAQFGTNATPAVIMLDQHEKVLDKMIGLVKKEDFLARLKAHAN